MRVTERQAGDLIELDQRIGVEEKALQRDTYRAVAMALRGEQPPVIAQAVGRSRRAVQHWVYHYRDGGIEELLPGKKTGQPTKLPRDREADFRIRLEAGPTPADGVCTLRGKDVVRILKEEFNASYTLDGAYDLLHRLGYSCLKPRPRHEKNDPAKIRSSRTTPPFCRKSSRVARPARDQGACLLHGRSAVRPAGDDHPPVGQNRYSSVGRSPDPLRVVLPVRRG